MPTAAEIRLLNSDEINPDRNKLNLLSPHFFRGEEDGKDYCKIVNMHDQGKNDLIQLVNPTHIRRWPRLWDAYQHGRARAAPTGTPLRRVLGLDEATILVLKQHEVPNAESLAGLDDEMLQILLGGAGQTARAAARQLVRLQQLEAQEAARAAPAPEAQSDEPNIPDVTAEADEKVAEEIARANRVKDLRAKQDAARKAG